MKIIKIIILLLALAVITYEGFYFYKQQKDSKQQKENQQQTSQQKDQNQDQDNQNNNQQEDTKKYPQLGIGNEGDYVVKLHQKLSDLGLFPSDSVSVNHYGEKTQHSVMLFQLTQDMEPNGVANQVTWTALYNPKPIDKSQLDSLSEKIPIDPGHVSEDTAQDKMVGTDTKIEVKDDTQTNSTNPDQEKTDKGKKIAYFTFDDGPNRNYSPEILKILDKYDARATFFVIGEEAEKVPNLLQKEKEHGCVIGNHTYSHINLETASKKEFMSQVTKTNDIVKSAVGYSPKCLRPPYGSIAKSGKKELLNKLGMKTVLWDVDPQDWSRPGTQNIINHVLKYIQPGEIILMHDGGGDRSESVAALETIMKTLSDKGWVFKSICDS